MRGAAFSMSLDGDTTIGCATEECTGRPMIVGGPGPHRNTIFFALGPCDGEVALILKPSQEEKDAWGVLELISVWKELSGLWAGCKLAILGVSMKPGLSESWSGLGMPSLLELIARSAAPREVSVLAVPQKVPGARITLERYGGRDGALFDKGARRAILFGDPCNMTSLLAGRKMEAELRLSELDCTWPLGRNTKGIFRRARQSLANLENKTSAAYSGLAGDAPPVCVAALARYADMVRLSLCELNRAVVEETYRRIYPCPQVYCLLDKTKGLYTCLARDLQNYMLLREQQSEEAPGPGAGGPGPSSEQSGPGRLQEVRDSAREALSLLAFYMDLLRQSDKSHLEYYSIYARRTHGDASAKLEAYGRSIKESSLSPDNMLPAEEDARLMLQRLGELEGGLQKEEMKIYGRSFGSGMEGPLSAPAHSRYALNYCSHEDLLPPGRARDGSGRPAASLR